ncbi:MAG: hypothetical protein EKK61_02925 [Rickettsiales bacterium]|nr:MAG: hypothetical protein EKK61_02925 [Rickettsiales bacterium]
MSAQLIELIIFAAIAFVIINKLISILGTTYEDDHNNKKSFFGEKTSFKDVTATGSASSIQSNILKPNFIRKNSIELKDLVVKEHELAVKEGLIELMSKVPSFDINKFLKGAKSAFSMIIDAVNKNDDDAVIELVDKRYIDQLKNIAISYGQITSLDAIQMQISEVYMFGNNIFIKILFIGENVLSKQKNLHDEWTFTKSNINSSPNWYLSNIDRAQ